MIYPAMIAGASTEAKPGDLVTVFGKEGRQFGSGLWNPKARVPLRVLHHGEFVVGEELFETRLTEALSLRQNLLGLDTGADDYVCKPFSPREVMARVKALLRRAEGRVAPMQRPWTVDDQGLRIAWRDRWLPLTPLEFRILRLLLSRPGRVFSRAQLLDSVHGDMRDVSDRAIDTHVKNLRRKVQAVDPGADCIASVYGVGYRFDQPT